MTMTCFILGASDSSNYHFSACGASSKDTIPTSRKDDPRMLSFKYTAIGPEPNSRLQFDRFHLSDESLVAVGEECADHMEHRVTEAADIHDVSSLTSLYRLVRL